MKQVKRWLALVLTVALIGTSVIYQFGTSMNANEIAGGDQAATQEEPAAEAKEEPAPAAKEEPPAKTEEKAETKEEPVAEAPAEPAQKESAPAAAETESKSAPAEAPVAEVKEENTEAPEEEAKMPAQNFSAAASNGISVNVTAPEGAFPEGTTMKVTAVSNSRALDMVQQSKPEAVSAQGVDITFYDKDGKEVEPAKKISVKLTGANVKGDNHSIYHVADNGDVEKVTSNATANGNGGSFTSKDFSIYIIEGSENPVEETEEQKVTITITFKNSKGQNVDPYRISEEVLLGDAFEKTIANIEDMETEVNIDEDASFLSWDAASGKLSGTVPNDASINGEEYTVSVIYRDRESSYTIKHMFENTKGEFVENESMREVIKGEAGHLTDAESHIKNGIDGYIPPDDVTEIILDADKTADEQVIELKYGIKEYKLSYNTQGGSYVAPQTGKYKEELTVFTGGGLECGKEEHTHVQPVGKPYRGAVSGCYKATGWGLIYYWTLNCGKEEHTHSAACYASISPVAKRPGYTFGGWYKDAACTQPADRTVTMTKNETVYAKWTKGTASYTTVFLKENVDGSYSYVSSKTGTAEVESKVTASGSVSDSTINTYYHVAEQTSATVKADGSTVVYVKYALNTYKFEFDISDAKDSTVLTMGGKQYKNRTSPKYTIECKLGEDISAKWPTADNFKVIKGDNFYGWTASGVSGYFVSKRFEVTTTMIGNTANGSTTTYVSNWDNGTKVVLHYMLQNADDNGYTDAERYRQTAYTTAGFSAKAIAGFNNVRKETKTEDSVTNYYFYYDRNTYNIDYYNGDNKTTKSNIRFEKDISGSAYTAAPANRPDGVDDDYEFVGWFDNKDGNGDAYNFNKMPASNLVLYAKYQAPERTVKLNYNYPNGTETKVKEETLRKGEIISVENPEFEGYEFIGWYTAAEDGRLYDFSEPIMNDVTVYAHWKKITTVDYTVKHVTEDGTEIIPTKTYTGKYGRDVRVNSITPDGDYAGYVVDHLYLTKTLSANPDENVFVFTYSKLKDATYNVRYVVEGSGDVLFSTVTGEKATQSVYKLKPKMSELTNRGFYGYEFVDASTQTFNVKSGENNFDFVVRPIEYNVTFANVDDSAWVKSHEKTYKVTDDSFNIMKNDSDVPTNKQGYELVGWTYNSDTVGIKVNSAGHNAVNPYVEKGSHADIVFTAVWAKLVGVDAEYEYDGTMKSFDATAHVEDVNGQTLSGYAISYYDADGNKLDALPQYKDVGTYEVTVVATKTGCRDLTKVHVGNEIRTTIKLIITPRTVTVKANDNSKTYGTNDPDPITSAIVTGLVGSDTVSYELSRAAGEKVGEYPITASGEKTQGNYKVTYEGGTFTIVKADTLIVQVTGNTATATYDGSKHEANGFTSAIISRDGDKLMTDDSLNVALKTGKTAHAEGVNAGEYSMNLKPEDFVATSDNYKNVVVQVVDGKLTINPSNEAITVTVTGNTATAVYDGKEHKVEGYSAVASDKRYDLSKVNFSGTAVASGTDAGTYLMGMNKGMFTNGDTNFSNVTFKVTDGKLTITPITDKITVTIEGKKAEKTYNGEEQSVSGYDVKSINGNDKYTDDNIKLAEGVAASAFRTDVGTSSMGLTSRSFVNSNANFTNVEFVVTDGSITIKKLAVTVAISGNAETATYDGTQHTVEGYNVDSISSELYNATQFSFNGNKTAARTEVGTTNMGLNKDQFTNNNNNFDVTFNVTDGSMTIEAITDEIVVKIAGNKDTKAYTGSEWTSSGYEVKEISSNLYSADDINFTGKAEAKRTDAGKTEMNLNNKQFSNNNPNFANVKFEVSDGYMEVTPAPVTVQILGNTVTATYDGEEHTATGYTVGTISGSDKYSAEYVKINDNSKAEAKRTEAGTTNMGLQASDFANTNNNFNVTFDVVDGYVEITEVDEVVVTITGTTKTVTYNGEEQSAIGYSISSSNALYPTSSVQFNGTDADKTAKGTDVGTYNMGLTREMFSNTNKNFKKVTFNVVNGAITINPLAVNVNIQGANDTQKYNGTERTVNGYTFTADSNLYVENNVKFTGTKTASRTDVGTTNMGLNANQFSNTNSNFTVSFNVTDGFIKITPVTEEVVVKVTGKYLSHVYDGAAHTQNGYSIDSSNRLYGEDDFSFNGTASATRTEAGTTTMGLAPGQFKNTSKNFTNVKFEVDKDGYVEITPLAVKVTVAGNKESKVYTGSEQTTENYGARANSTLYDVTKDITFTGVAEAKGTDVGKYPMNLTDTQFANNNSNFTVTFDVTDGELEVTPVTDKVTVTITGNQTTATYDAKTHEAAGYATSISNDLYTAADFAFSGDASVTETNAGSYDMGLAKNQFENTSKNFTNVEFVVNDGKLVINKANATVTITGNNNAVAYDGEEHTATGYEATVSSDGDLYTKGDFSFKGTAEAKRTDVGTTNMNLAAEQFTNNNANFTVTFNVTDGYMTILDTEAVLVTITGHKASKVYNGKEQEVTGYEVTIAGDKAYKASDFTFSGTAKAAGTAAGKYPMGLDEKQFTNNNANYNGKVKFVVTDGELEITKQAVTVAITGHNDSKVYNGSEQGVKGYDVAITDASKLYTKDDFTFSGTAEAKRTDVGTTDMGLNVNQFSNSNANFDVTFTVADGHMTITPVTDKVTVTITGNKVTETYDGQVHTATGYETEISNELYAEGNFTFSGNATATRTDAGTTEMGLAKKQFKNNSDNFTNVDFVVTDGSVTINKAKATVTITGNHDSKVYDGKSHEVTDYSVDIDNKLYKESMFGFDGTAVASGTNVGTYNMGLDKKQFSNSNTNFDVTFNVTDGYIEITPVTSKVTVTITGNSETATYDAKQHAVSGYATGISNDLYTADDFSFTGNAAAARTDAGRTNMGLVPGQFENNSSNFTNVVFIVNDGYVQIDKREVAVTVTGNTDTKTYDGTEHKVNGYKAEISDELYTANDFKFNGTDTAARTEVGTTQMGLAQSQFENKNGNFTVTFSVTDGSITVVPKDTVVVTITGNKKTVTYNGEEQEVTGYSFKSNDPLYTANDMQFTGDAVAKGTNASADAYPMGLTGAMFSNTNKNFENVVFQVTDGSLTINKLPVTVTVTGNNDTLVYDGKAHTVEGYDAKASSTLYDTAKDLAFSGTDKVTGTDADTYNMGLQNSAFTNNNDNFDVTVNVTDGFLKITPVTDKVTVTVKGNTDTAVYDYARHESSGYTTNISNKLYDESLIGFTGTATATRTNVGTSYMRLAAGQFSNTSTNFTNVEFVVESDGWMKVTPRDVTVNIVGRHVTAVYDGNEHSVKGLEIIPSDKMYSPAAVGFNGNDIASRTNVGKTQMGLELSQFRNYNDNFNVTFVITDGYAEVTPVTDKVTVTITGNQTTATYDAKSHEAAGYATSISNDLYTAADFAFSGDASVTETNAGSYDMGLAKNQFENTSKNFTNVEFVVNDGKLVINKANATVTITGNNNAVAYDGEEHTATGYEATVSSDGDLYTKGDFSFKGTAEAKRTDVGTTNMNLAAEQFTNNNANFTVAFNVTDGYMTILDTEEVLVTITGHKASKVYNGKEQEVTGYEVTIAGDKAYKASDFTFSGTAKAAGTAAGKYPMGLDEKQFTNNNANYNGKVKFVVTDGELEITKQAVTVAITGHNDSKVYNGSEQGVKGYDVAITDASKLYTKDDFTFSGTAEAKRTDVGTTDMGLNVNQFSNSNANFDVTFTVADGHMTITPVTDKVTVTITGNKVTETYDGQVHTATGYETEISNELYAEGNFTFSGNATATRTDAGTTEMGLAKKQFKNNSDNFTNVDFVVTDGSVTINKAKATVTITGNHDSKVYDGKSHEVTDYSVDIDNKLYKESMFGFDGTAVASGTNVGIYNMGLDKKQFTNSNTNFDVTFNVTDGYIEITPVTSKVTVTITGNSETATYDAKQHAVSGYATGISNDLYTADDFSFTGNAAAARTDAGRTNMGLVPGQFENNSSNFTNVVFIVNDGYVQIDKREVAVTVTGNTDTKTYDGTEHKVNGYKAEISDELYTANDFKFNGTDTAARTEVGTTQMGLAQSQFENKNGNFTVTFSVTDGSITVVPKDTVVVTITGNKKTVTYNGEEQEVTGYSFKSNDPLYTANDMQFTGDAVAKGTNASADAYPMGLTGAMFSNTNKNFENVVFQVTDGSLTINKLPVTVTVTGNNDTLVYDGKAHTVEGYDAKASSTLYDTAKNLAFSGTDKVTGTDADTYNMGLQNSAFTNNNDNFDVTVNVTDGFLKITPVTDKVTVTVKGNTDTAVYDYARHESSGYTTNISNKLYDESLIGFTGTATATRTNVGTSYMRLAAGQFSNTSKNFTNVEFVVESDGWMKVTPRDVTVNIVGRHATAVYDGNEHSVKGFEIIPSDKMYSPAAVGFNGNDIASRTNVGKTQMGLELSQFRNYNDNFNVTFVITDGYAEVTPVTDKVTVTITGNNVEDTYDATEKKATGYTVDIDNGLYTTNDFTFDGDATVARTDAGTTQMGLAKKQFANISDNFTNVEFVVTDGYAKVNPRAVKVSVTGNNDTKVYDGNKHSINGYQLTCDDNLYSTDDVTFSGKAEATRKDVGTDYMNLAADQFGNSNSNFNVSFEIAQDGFMTITPAEAVIVKITGKNKSKVYDGEPLEVEGYDITNISNGLYTADDFTFTGNDKATQTNAGTNQMGLNDKQFVNNSNNFKSVVFVVTDGYATVTKRPVTVTVKGSNDTQEFDGTEKTVTGYEPGTEDELYDLNSIEFNGDAQVKRTDFGQTDMGLTSGNFTNNDDNFDVTFDVTDGFVKITRKSVTVTADDNKKQYAAADPNLTATVATTCNGDVLGYTVEREAGELVGEYPIHVTGEKIQGNYEVTYVDGKFTITDDPEKPTSVITKKADGKEYKLGDKATYTIKVKNIYNVAKDITITEQSGALFVDEAGKEIGSEVKFENVAAGAEVSATAVHVITEADIKAGTYKNKAVAKFGPIEFPGEEDVDTETPEATLSATKHAYDADGKELNADSKVKLGAVISYKVTVKNTGNITVNNVVVNDESTGAKDVKVGNLEPGAQKTVEVGTHKVTEDDIVAGSYRNVATASGEASKVDETVPQPANPETTAETTTGTDDLDNSIEVTKKSNLRDGDKAGLGDEITYTITVTNKGNVTVSDVNVEDKLTGNTGDKALKVDGDIKPGESKSVTATYVVTESDILEGKILNIATAKGTDPKNDSTEDEGKTEDPTDPKNNRIEVTKKSNLGEGEKAVLGEEITYTITVTNKGNVTVSDVNVEDELTGNTGDKALKVEGDIKPGQSKEVTATYVVTEKDILAGKIVNTATAKGTDPDGEPTKDEGKDETETEDLDTTINMIKKSDVSGKVLKAGDTVNYTIDVTNAGNVTYKNVVVTDKLDGAVIDKDEAYTVNEDGTATIDELAVGKTVTVKVHYVVTEDDLRAENVTNIATAKADPIPDPKGGDKTPEGEGKVTDTTEKARPSVFIKKEVTGDKATYAAGDTITYQLTVTNDGNVALADINVVDELTGLTESVDELAVGDAQSFETTYVVTEKDTINGEVKNVATVKATDPKDPGNDGIESSSEVVSDTVKARGHMTVKKTVTSKPADGNAYRTGEKIAYKIVVTNDGNLTITNAAVTDKLTGDKWTIKSLAPGAKKTFTTTYTVTAADAARGTVVNTATATGKTEDPDNDPEVTPGKVTEEVTPDNTPVVPPGNPGANPGGNPAPAGPIAVIGNIIANIQPIMNNDDDTPLAQQNLDNCCIFHFLLMLMSLLVIALYSRSMKKRQAKIHELKEELDTELTKRGLPLSDEQ